MTLKFVGTYEELQKKLESLKGEWRVGNSEQSMKVFTYNKVNLNWFETTGTLQFQGKLPDKKELENCVAHLLYPNEYKLKPEEESISEESTETSPATPTDANQSKSIEIKDLTSEINDSELIIGIVKAVGTESSRVIFPLTDKLEVFGYTVEEIRVSDILPQPKKDKTDKTGENGEYNRIKYFIAQGNLLREKYDNSILAAGVTERIRRCRRKEPKPKKAYIVNSLKHPSEIEFLREVYGNGFYLFGIHAERERRCNYLKNKGLSQDLIDELIKIDEEEGIEFGQKTRDTYHLSDFFINLGNNDDQLKNRIQRFLELIFSNPYRNPTFDEFAMFMAFNSSVRSSDLSRQVGAVLTRNNQIIATGANDVPKFGGGQYWTEIDGKTGEFQDKKGGKDYTRGKDSNKKVQNEIISEIVDAIEEKGLIESCRKDKLREILEKSKISDLTEFGRVVHAEMETILSCNRVGISTIDTTLYCTTFPCHNCAKHIIASGIKRVVYVEPYPKSRALELHSDSIKLKSNPEESDNNSFVVFEPFMGVGSRRFLDLFSMNLGTGSKLKRKSKEGDILDWDNKDAVLRTPISPKSYIDREADASNKWDESIQKQLGKNN